MTIKNGAYASRLLAVALGLSVSLGAAFGETVTFDVGVQEGLKRGRVGFLNSIKADVLPPEWITEIAPAIWRGGGGWNPDGIFDIYEYFTKKVGVKRVIMELGLNKGVNKDLPVDVAAERMVLNAKKRGQIFDSVEIKNEPNLWSANDPEKAKPDIVSPPISLEDFMQTVWIPAYRGIKRADPSANVFGPSISMVSKVLPNCREKLFAFIDAAIKSETLPDYINWHFQDGYDIAASHTELANEIRRYVAAKGATIKGVAAGETIRPGDERNTSPAVAIDVFAASEFADMDQIHAAWSSTPVYGQKTSPEPVLGGLLTKDYKGRRGVWWTYQFYAQTKGQRLKCQEGMSGSVNLVGLAFADESGQKVRALIGARDGAKAQPDSVIRFENILGGAPYLVKDGKVRVRVLANPQTEFAVEHLDSVLERDVELDHDGVSVRVDISKWGAVLVELLAP
ncbi:MAG: hypothetical protein EBS01_03865 [Verrucomicrobia bacterium]|nr:hypothetical protein [Verrucomicrobiota bacterium]